MRYKFLFFYFSFFLIAQQIVFADCIVEKICSSSGQYEGCKVIRDGVVKDYTASRITDKGCETMCPPPYRGPHCKGPEQTLNTPNTPKQQTTRVQGTICPSRVLEQIAHTSEQTGSILEEIQRMFANLDKRNEEKLKPFDLPNGKKCLILPADDQSSYQSKGTAEFLMKNPSAKRLFDAKCDRQGVNCLGYAFHKTGVGIPPAWVDNGKPKGVNTLQLLLENYELKQKVEISRNSSGGLEFKLDDSELQDSDLIAFRSRDGQYNHAGVVRKEANGEVMVDSKFGNSSIVRCEMNHVAEYYADSGDSVEIYRFRAQK
jgi:hypothetical protein